MKINTIKIIFLLLISNNLFSQVGIGTVTPQGALDVISTNEGLLIPRIALTATNIATVLTPTVSEMVYNTATSSAGPNEVVPGFYFWSGSLWIKVSGNNVASEICTFSQFSLRPTGLTVADAGKKCLYTQTGNFHLWTGSTWQVLNETVINVKDYGAIGDGTTDDSGAINLSIIKASAVAESNKTVLIPSGRYKISAAINIINTSGLNIIGQGKDATKIFCSSAFTMVNCYISKNLELSNIGFEASFDSVFILVLTNCSKLNINNCGFQLQKSCDALFIDKSNEISITDSKFFSLGKKLGTGIQTVNTSQEISVERNNFSYLENGVIIGGNCKIKDNYFDGGFYTAVPTFTGTGTFTATGMNASGGLPFVGFDTATIPTIYSEKAAGNFINNGNLVKDPSKNFVSLGLLIGDIVLTTNCIGVIKTVKTDELEVEEWLDKTTRLPINATAEVNYQAFKIYIGRNVNTVGGGGYTTSSVSVQGWWDMAGTDSIPPSGSKYEICPFKGNYQILMSQADFNAVITNNIIKRPYSDGIGIFASSFLVSNNYIYKTNDMGITISPGSNTEPNHYSQGIVSDNVIEFAATNGIYLGYSAGVVVTNNRIMDSGTAMTESVYDYAAGIDIEYSSDCIVSNNLINKRLTTKMSRGIYSFAGVSGTAPTNFNILLNNNVVVAPLF
jgi:Pectate lyase superfamily protein/Right handed beta helix region